MKSSVDVWVARQAAAALTPPLRSVINGAEAAVTVRTCVLRRPLQRRIEMSLTVDSATAEQFSRTCRWQNIWERRVIPAAIVVALALGIFGDDIDSRVPYGMSLLVVVLVVAAAAGRHMLVSKASPHHPRLQKGDTVLVRSVDREVAHGWLSLNSPEAMSIAD
jgi:hypothetical protein